MSKKLYGALLPVLAVVAFAIVPAASQAAGFHWYRCKHEATATHKFSDSECQKEVAGTGSWEWSRLPFSETKTQAITFGKLKLTASNGLVIECKVLDAGNIWNPVGEGPGKDNIEVFINYECKAVPETTCATVSVTAKGLPWTTELAAGPVDKIKAIEILVNCAGTELMFTGEIGRAHV